MNAKEKRYVRGLEIRVEQLERHLKIAQASGTESFLALYDTRTALMQVFAAIEEAAVIMHECIKNDPQYMAQKAVRRMEINQGADHVCSF